MASTDVYTPPALAKADARRHGAVVGRSASTRRRRGFLRPDRWLPTTVLVVVLGVLWEVGATTMPYLLPPLSSIAQSLIDNPGHYLSNAWVTLQAALIGLAIAFVVSFALAVLISELPIARRAVMPIAVVMNVTPVVAIVPALVVAFGFGPTPKLVVTALICFFPILINVSVGLRAVPSAVLQFYQTIRASRLELLWHVRIPMSLPYLFAALRIVFPLSITGAVVAEMFAPGGTGGLGTAISLASSQNQLSAIYASIAVLAFMGAMLLFIVNTVERRVLHWHETQGSGG